MLTDGDGCCWFCNYATIVQSILKDLCVFFSSAARLVFGGGVELSSLIPLYFS